MLSVRVPKSLCPYCDNKLDAAGSLDGEHTPQNGDISLCINCAQILMFDENLQLRKPSIDEEREALSDENVVKAQKYIKSLDRRS